MKPPRNRKGESGNPPPKATASEFYPNHLPPSQVSPAQYRPRSLRAQTAMTLREQRSAAGSPCMRDALPCAMQILLSW